MKFKVAAAAALVLVGVLGWFFASQMSTGLRGLDRGIEPNAGAADAQEGADVLDPSTIKVEGREPASVALGALAASEPDAPEATTQERSGVGRVVDQSGAPVPGCEVRFLSLSNYERRLGGSPLSPMPQTTTDEVGEFELPDCPPRSVDSWYLRAAKPGYAPTFAGVPDMSDPTRFDYGDVVLSPGVRVEGVVLGPDGQPVPGAEISPSNAGRMRDPFGNFGNQQMQAIATSDELGAFTIDGIPAGAFAFTARHPEFLLAEAAGQASLEEPLEPLVLRLGAASSISGIVRGLPGEVMDLTVSARTQGYEDLAESYGYDIGSRRYPIQGDGSFTVTGVRPGAEMWLDVWTDTYAHMRSQRRSPRVPAADGDSDVILEYTPGFDVRFSVLWEGTEEVVEAITPGVEFGDAWNGLIAPTGLDADPPLGWPGGEVLATGLVAPRPGLPLTVFVIGRGASLSLEFTEFPETGQLDLGDIFLPLPKPKVSELPLAARVSVRYPDGTRAEHVRVRFIPPSEWAALGQGGGAQWVAEPGEDGDFEVRTAETGTAYVGLNMTRVVGGDQAGADSSFNDRSLEPIGAEVVLKEGATAEVVLEHPARHGLTLRVERGGLPAAGYKVVLHSYGLGAEDLASGRVDLRNRRGWLASLGDSGEVTIPNLLPGTCTLTIRDPMSDLLAVRTVTLEERDTELAIFLSPTEVHGRVIDESGEPVPGALVAILRKGESTEAAGRIFSDRAHGEAPMQAPMQATEHAGRSSLHAVTDGAGRYRFDLDLTGSIVWRVVAAAPAAVHATSPDFSLGSSRVTIDDLMLGRAGSLKIKRTAEGSTPFVAVGRREQSAAEAFDGVLRADIEETSALFYDLEPGEWIVHWLSDTAETMNDATQQAVRVTAGETTEIVLAR